MLKGKREQRGLLLDIYHRNAGSAVIDGENRAWGEGDFVVLLPYEDARGRVVKYPIRTAEVRRFYQLTETVNWGAFVSIELDQKEAVDLTVIADFFSTLESFDL